MKPKKMNLAIRLYEYIAKSGQATLKKLYRAFPGEKEHTIRGRMSEGVGVLFVRCARGAYDVERDEIMLEETTRAEVLYEMENGKDVTKSKLFLFRGDGTHFSWLPDASFHAIITDHPWVDVKAHKGGNRLLASVYGETYTEEHFGVNYTKEHFAEKHRLLKKGCFLAEFLPFWKETNWQYLVSILENAAAVGFEFYALMPWNKGHKGLGRTENRLEQVLLFTKGKPRSLNFEQKAWHERGELRLISGVEQLPSILEQKAAPPKKRVHPNEKPVSLLSQLVRWLTKPGEWVLDQFGGSGNLGETILTTQRNGLIVDLAETHAKKWHNRFAYPNGRKNTSVHWLT